MESKFKKATKLAARAIKGKQQVEPQAPTSGPQSDGMVTIPFNPPLSVGRGKEYTGGLSDEELHRIATEAGREGIHTEAWGKNAAEQYVEDALRYWHDVNKGLISHEYTSVTEPINSALDHLDGQVDEAEEDALDAVESHGDLELEREELHLRMAREGLEPPNDQRDWGLGLKLGGLVVADIGLLSVAYQVLDLSDERFLGIPFLSENALAASGPVLALVLLAHLAGQQLKTGLHHLNLANEQATNKEVN